MKKMTHILFFLGMLFFDLLHDIEIRHQLRFLEVENQLAGSP